MNIKKKIVVFVMMMSLLVVATAVWALEGKAAPDSTGTGYITEFPIAVADSMPQNLAIETAGSPASIWFTMFSADAIGHMVVTSTVDFAFSSYPVTAGSGPFDIVYDGNAEVLWFTERQGNRIGRFDIATETLTEIAVPNGYSPAYIDVASNGDVWFTEPTANQVVRYQPGPQLFTAFPYNVIGGSPTRIEVLNTNSVWITVPMANRVAELDVMDGSYNNITVNDPNSPAFAPDGLALDSSGPWITAPSQNRIGRYAPGTVAFWNWYLLSKPANALAYDESGGLRELWFTNTAAGEVGRLLLNISGNLVSLGYYELPTPDSQPTDIATAADGTVWIVESAGNQIAAWYPPYFYQASLPFVVR